jgi:hypothetical protein
MSSPLTTVQRRIDAFQLGFLSPIKMSCTQQGRRRTLCARSTWRAATTAPPRSCAAATARHHRAVSAGLDQTLGAAALAGNVLELVAAARVQGRLRGVPLED